MTLKLVKNESELEKIVKAVKVVAGCGFAVLQMYP